MLFSMGQHGVAALSYHLGSLSSCDKRSVCVHV